MTAYAQHRQQVYRHDYTILLQHEPIRHLIREWKRGKSYDNCITEEDFIRVTSRLLEELGPTQFMHYGDIVTSTRQNKAPSHLLSLLWLLRYAIHDKQSHRNLIRLLAPDTFSSTDSGSTFLTLEFFMHYILNPVVYIIRMLVTHKESLVYNIIMNDYVTKPNTHMPKIEEFMMYSLTSNLIEIVLQHGPEPSFTEQNEATLEIQNYLKLEDTVPSTLYELFFSALPGIIERNVRQHSHIIFRQFVPKKDILQTKFPLGTTIHNFEINLPLTTDRDTTRPVTLRSYFTALCHGKVYLENIIGEVHQVQQSQHDLSGDHNLNTEGLNLRVRQNIDYTESPMKKTPTKKKEKIIIPLSEDTYNMANDTITENTRTLVHKLNQKKNKLKEKLTTLQKDENGNIQMIEEIVTQLKELQEMKSNLQKIYSGTKIVFDVIHQAYEKKKPKSGEKDSDKESV
jgi:hypothetical protein